MVVFCICSRLNYLLRGGDGINKCLCINVIVSCVKVKQYVSHVKRAQRLTAK